MIETKLTFVEGQQPQRVSSVNTGFRGARGQSAYEVALDEGFVGTEAQWLASLQGEKGDVGDVNPQMPIILAATEDARDASVLAAQAAAQSETDADAHRLAAAGSATTALGAEQGAVAARNAAEGHATTATQQAGIATTKAGEANADATQTALDRVATGQDVLSTAQHATTATNQAGIATAAAGTATTKAGEADASAVAAGQHAQKAQKWASEVEDTEVEPGLFSALHWAAKAAASAATAAGDLIDDAITSLVKTWSSSKIAAALSGKVDDTDPRLSDARTPTGGAGGVLAGQYPNPGFAVDMATQAELDSAIAGREPAGAAASAISTHEAAADPHPGYILETEKAAANGVATLGADSKIPAAQLPAIAITEYLGESADQTAMLALAGQSGDWTIRTDLGTVWIIKGADPSLLADWQELGYPTAPVTSVASKTGAVTLETADVSGAVDTTDARLTDAREWTADTISQEEAEAGTATTRRAWTAQGVRQAIAAWWSSVALAANNSFTGLLTVIGVRETVHTFTGTTPSIISTSGRIAVHTLSGATTPTSGLSAGDSVTVHVTRGAHAYNLTNFTTVNDTSLEGTVTIYTFWRVGSTSFVAKVGSY